MEGQELVIIICSECRQPGCSKECAKRFQKRRKSRAKYRASKKSGKDTIRKKRQRERQRRANPELFKLKQREKARRKCRNLSNGYVRSIISKTTSLKRSEIPHSFVECKRALLRVRRYLLYGIT